MGMRTSRLGLTAGGAMAVLGLASCGLVRFPFRVVGSVANTTIQTGETVYRKSKETLHRDKNDESSKDEKSKEATGKNPAAQGVPDNGGLLPDLPPEPDANPSGASSGTPPPSSDAGNDFSEPPLPELPE